MWLILGWPAVATVTYRNQSAGLTVTAPERRLHIYSVGRTPRSGLRRSPATMRSDFQAYRTWNRGRHRAVPVRVPAAQSLTGGHRTMGT